MKAILCVLLLALTAHAQTVEWKRVTFSDRASFYVAPARDERDESGTVRRWVKVEPRQDTDDGRAFLRETADQLAERGVEATRAARYSYVLRWEEFDCPAGRSRFLKFTYYDDEGRSLYTTPNTEKGLGEWTSPTPESIGETLMLDACKPRLELH